VVAILLILFPRRIESNRSMSILNVKFFLEQVWKKFSTPAFSFESLVRAFHGSRRNQSLRKCAMSPMLEVVPQLLRVHMRVDP
jgi:hypothetical protein